MKFKKQQNGFNTHPTHQLSPSKSSFRCHEQLPTIETAFYWITGLGSIAYTFYEVHKASWDYVDILNKEDFEDGWKLIGHKKDISNYEWHYWSSYFWHILPWALGHIAISAVANSYFVKFRQTVFLAYSLLCLVWLLGYRAVLFFTLHCCICYLASSSACFLCVWTVSFLLLSTLNYDALLQSMINIIQDGPIDESESYFYIFVLALVILRYTSFCLERSQHLAGKGSNSDRSEHNYSLRDLLLYVFYLPLFFTGPLLTYDQFHVQINSDPQPWTKQRLKKILMNIFRVLFWAVFIEISHHFLYHNALLHSQAALESMSLWCLFGLGYIEGQYFMVKYVVLYGLPGCVAEIDGLHAPEQPKCISYIYRYSDMWKYFDRGLYNFLRNYIYIPLGGSQAGVGKQLLSSLLCFLYIYAWHGQELYLLLWVLINFLGCSLELIGAKLEDTRIITSLKKRYLSPATTRRIRCCLCVPLFLLSVFSVFYFFSGITVGDTFITRLIVNASNGRRLLLLCVIYVNIQNAMEVERLKASKAKIQ